MFFGLKNLHGYLWRLQDDEFVKVNADTSVTHLAAPSIYGSWTCGVETGMKAFSTSPTQVNGGYIKRASYDNLELFPTEVGGSAGTYHCDCFWNNSGLTSGFRVVLRGCGASGGSGSGVFDVDVSDAVSASYVNLGSPLCEAVEEWPVEPVYTEVV